MFPLADAKLAYRELVMTGFKIFNMIDRLRVDHPLLNRPFMYHGHDLQAQMIKHSQALRKSMALKFYHQDRESKKHFDLVMDEFGMLTDGTTYDKQKTKKVNDNSKTRDDVSQKHKNIKL